MKKSALMKKSVSLLCCLTLVSSSFMLSGCEQKQSDEIVLRISNWEEYIDLGDWGEDEMIELDNCVVMGENSLVDDFEEWYYENYGQKVKVEYSTFGTNEELYNQLTIGDVYDLVCPSEYMIMKMMRENMLVPLSEEFFDEKMDGNYYAKGLSPYIKQRFDELNIDGNVLSKYAAGYMWGTLGLVYNPEEVSKEDAEHWEILLNKDYFKRVTIKDSVRDAYFGAICYANYDEITSDEFLSDPNYHKGLSETLNRTDKDTVDLVQDVLTKCKNNVYSFETDAGKADLVTGKVVANQQWSGDAVYTMDQAMEDGMDLCYSAPLEGTNLWFDGWVMLKSGINEDIRKQQAAEAFINFVSMPENAIRNMYYIGYTSVISGGEDDSILQYVDYNYGIDEGDEDEAVEYNFGYFFDMDNPDSEDYTILTYEDQLDRQLFAQYPTKDVVDRSVVMACFNDEDNVRINKMWTNVRCFDLSSIFK